MIAPIAEPMNRLGRRVKPWPLSRLPSSPPTNDPISPEHEQHQVVGLAVCPSERLALAGHDPAEPSGGDTDDKHVQHDDEDGVEVHARRPLGRLLGSGAQYSGAEKVSHQPAALCAKRGVSKGGLRGDGGRVSMTRARASAAALRDTHVPAHGDLPAYILRVSPRAKHVRLNVSPHEGLVVVVPRGARGFDPTPILRSKKTWIDEVPRALRRIYGKPTLGTPLRSCLPRSPSPRPARAGESSTGSRTAPA